MASLDELTERWPGIGWYVATRIIPGAPGAQLEALSWADGPTEPEVQAVFPGVTLRRQPSAAVFASHVLVHWWDDQLPKSGSFSQLTDAFYRQLDAVSHPPTTEHGRVLVGLACVDLEDADSVCQPDASHTDYGEFIVEWLIHNGGPDVITAALS